MSARSTTKTTTDRPPSTSKERGRILSTKVRTTIEPGKVLEVDDAELVDLHRQGLLHSHESSDHTAALGLKSANRWRDGKAETVDSGIVTDSGDGAKDDNADKSEGESK